MYARCSTFRRCHSGLRRPLPNRPALERIWRIAHRRWSEHGGRSRFRSGSRPCGSTPLAALHWCSQYTALPQASAGMRRPDDVAPSEAFSNPERIRRPCGRRPACRPCRCDGRRTSRAPRGLKACRSPSNDRRIFVGFAARRNHSLLGELPVLSQYGRQEVHLAPVPAGVADTQLPKIQPQGTRALHLGGQLRGLDPGLHRGKELSSGRPATGASGAGPWRDVRASAWANRPLWRAAPDAPTPPRSGPRPAPRVGPDRAPGRRGETGVHDRAPPELAAQPWPRQRFRPCPARGTLATAPVALGMFLPTQSIAARPFARECESRYTLLRDLTRSHNAGLLLSELFLLERDALRRCSNYLFLGMRGPIPSWPTGW